MAEDEDPRAVIDRVAPTGRKFRPQTAQEAIVGCLLRFRLRDVEAWWALRERALEVSAAPAEPAAPAPGTPSTPVTPADLKSRGFIGPFPGVEGLVYFGAEHELEGHPMHPHDPRDLPDEAIEPLPERRARLLAEGGDPSDEGVVYNDHPVATKAGATVTSVAFLAPGQGPDEGVRLPAHYPMQLQLRVDPHKQRLYVEYYDLTPEGLQTSCSALTGNHARKRLRSMFGGEHPGPFKRHNDSWYFTMYGRRYESESDSGEEEAGEEAEAAAAPAETDHICQSAAAFADSRVCRFALPLADIVGAALVGPQLLLDLAAPQAEGPGWGGFPRFAMRRVRPKTRTEGRFAVTADWTPEAAASRASRLVVSGNPGELAELAAYLAAAVPSLAALLAVSHVPPPPPAFVREPAAQRTVAQVHEALAAAGVEDPAGVSACVRAAMLRGHLELSEGLDTALVEVPLGCSRTADRWVISVRDVLEQQEHADRDFFEDYWRFGDEAGRVLGDDGEEVDESDLAEGAPTCPNGCCQQFVSYICQGTPTLSRSFHHCSQCPGFGDCVGDVRNEHCECGEHALQPLCDRPPCCSCGSLNGKPARPLGRLPFAAAPAPAAAGGGPAPPPPPAPNSAGDEGAEERRAAMREMRAQIPMSALQPL